MRPARALTLLCTACVVALGLAAGAPAATTPAAGSLDQSFGRGGFSIVGPTGQFAVAGAVAVQSDGRIVTAGQWRQDSGRDVMLATRMLPDGRLDKSFGSRGVVTVQVGVGSGANALAIQPDGRIVLAGTGTAGGRIVFAAVRLLRDGSLDPSFGGGGVATVPIGEAAIATGVALQRDGRIALGGTARLRADDVTTNRLALARLNADGTIDRSFGSSGASLPLPGVTAAGWGIALQGDGRLVLGGQAGADTSSSSTVVVRTLPDGSADSAFGAGGAVIRRIGTVSVGHAIAVQGDGRIVVAGNAFDGRGVAATMRLLPDGSLDPAFGSGGISEVTLWDAVNAMALQPDGRIVLAATSGHSVRLTAAGAADDTYGTAGIATNTLGSNTAANGVAVQADGRLVFAGITVMPSGDRPLVVYRVNG